MLSSFSLILPCYNEEENIAQTVADVTDWLRACDIDGEIIVVDDGSTDSSADLLAEMQTKNDLLKVIMHDKNKGYGLAVRSGLDAAAKDVIGFMDSDRQFHAEHLDLLLPGLEQASFVAGRRTKRADTLLRNAFGKGLGVCTWIVFGLWLRDVNCGMKIFRREIWPAIRPEHGVEKLFNTELFLNLRKNNIAWVQMSVPHYPRTAGTPTGASPKVILRMFGEYRDLKKAQIKQNTAEL